MRKKKKRSKFIQFQTLFQTQHRSIAHVTELIPIASFLTIVEVLIVQNNDPDDVIQDDCVKRVTAVIEHLCDEAAGQGRTAALWINYFMQVSIIHLFLYTQRELVTGGFMMITYFHAACEGIQTDHRGEIQVTPFDDQTYCGMEYPLTKPSNSF